MIRSMTGYGEAECATESGSFRVELKTVNHRFFNAVLRTPPGFDRLEAEIQGWLRAGIARGHVTFSLQFDPNSGGGSAPLPQLDIERATRYVSLLNELQAELALPGEVELSHLTRFGEIFRAPDQSPSPTDIDPEMLEELIQQALAGMIGMREAEGARLQVDLEARLDAIAGHLDVVSARAPERLVAERDRLREAVAELTDQADVDEDRLAREIAYLAEKWDINEELVRFRSHLELFAEGLGGDVAEPAGKRLGFVVQEMHREANTIGSKANDTEISRASVAMKEEIERLREQLENVE
ncbi:MAG: YicC/YloC family endoribonuclease [Longimicrobiales bacterium]